VEKFQIAMAAEESVRQKYNSSTNNTMDRIMITYYTDPLCCWCWAMETPWNRLLEEYGNQITFRYVLGGMIPDWSSYHDPLNAVSCPLQMGPVWMHAAQVTQTKINYSIWHTDPPSSSYPSCIAIKCAGLQSLKAEHRYLQKIRKAVMIDGLNISKSEVLLQLAEELENELPDLFNASQFMKDRKSNTGRDALRKDMERAAFHKIGRYPTLTLIKQGSGLIMTGYRPYEELKKALENVLTRIRSDNKKDIYHFA